MKRSIPFLIALSLFFSGNSKADPVYCDGIANKLLNEFGYGTLASPKYAPVSQSDDSEGWIRISPPGNGTFPSLSVRAKRAKTIASFNDDNSAYASWNRENASKDYSLIMVYIPKAEYNLSSNSIEYFSDRELNIILDPKCKISQITTTRFYPGEGFNEENLVVNFKKCSQNHWEYEVCKHFRTDFAE
jgi:hypothetical protein